MKMNVIVFICALLLIEALGFGQEPPSEHQLTIQTTQSWTDTGLDLQSGELIEISASRENNCDPAGVGWTGSPSGVPVPSAPLGALIAKTAAQEPALLIGIEKRLTTTAAGHLFLGVNAQGIPPCDGSFSVRVVITPAKAAAGQGLPATNNLNTASTPTTNTTSQTPAAGHSNDIKKKLQTAAQVWLSGQFGKSNTGDAGTTSNATTGTGGTATAAADIPALKVSETPIDSAFRKDIDGLPRRVNDQFQNVGDMVNFILVGSEDQLKSALQAATWHVADTNNRESAINAVLQTYQKKDYLTMPMSELYLFGRVQDFGYEEAEPYSVVASRHHFRIWKAPFTWNGQTVWAGAGTHDIGFEKDQRNGKVTHKIDPAVDGERDNIGQTLQSAGKVKSMSYYLPPDPVKEAKNATGGGYHSDGRILVVFLE